jgi:cysteinyl-tRNA synthetase
MNKVAQYIVVILLVFLAGALTGWKFQAYFDKLEWSLRDLADSKAENAALEKNQATTADATASLEKQKDDTDKKLQQAVADARTADIAADGLRDTIDTLQRQLRDSTAAKDTAVAGQREAATHYAGMLAIVLKQSDERAGQLAKAADDARIRGQACQKAYETIREKYQ